MILKLKWNWGSYIVVAYTIFIILIMSAVITALNQKVDLVTEDYYAQEINYQAKYDKMENAGTLKEPITATQQGGNVVITFPKEVKAPYSGKVLFYRPSNSADDVTVAVNTNADGQMIVPIGILKKGNYSVLIDWVGGSTKYFNKLIIFIR